MGTKIQVSADQSRRSSMMLADVPKRKRLLECDFLHKMDQAASKSVQSMVIFSLKKLSTAYEDIMNEMIYLIYKCIK